MATSRDMYQEITDNVIDALEKGTIPWEKPWSLNGDRKQPRSVSTGKVYQGINWIMLGPWMFGASHSSPWWMTFKQAQKLCIKEWIKYTDSNGKTRSKPVYHDESRRGVRKGEKSYPIVHWSFIDGKHPAGHPKAGQLTGRKIPILRHFSAFNLDQCDMPDEVVERLAKRLDRLAGEEKQSGTTLTGEAVEAAKVTADKYISREGIKFNDAGSLACYSPMADIITMPEVKTFTGAEEYLATLLHECVHSTGIEKRLKRGIEKNGSKGSESYAREELVAELGSAFAAARLGINMPTVNDNRNAYIANWIAVLENDKKALIWAAGRAEKATNLIIGDRDDQGEAEPSLEWKGKG